MTEPIAIRHVDEGMSSSRVTATTLNAFLPVLTTPTSVVNEYVEHYNCHRPHRSLSQKPPQPRGLAAALPKNVDSSRLKRASRLGGVIHEYRLVA
jgi:hypothetical protein